MTEKDSYPKMVEQNTMAHLYDSLSHILDEIDQSIWKASDEGKWQAIFDYSKYHISSNGLEYIMSFI